MLVLASASPRRQELLRNAGIEFTVQAPDIPEVPLADEPPRSFAERMAREKALAVFRSQPNEVVLGADTIVVVDDQILGKPRDVADAARMLRLLSGRTHTVTTGVCLAGPQQGMGPPFLDFRSETSSVTFTGLNDSDIQFYVSTGEPLDKAGAYAIQGMASRWITRIEGDYCNVVGLPVALVWRMLKEHEVA
jgi:septum formation protein